MKTARGRLAVPALLVLLGLTAAVSAAPAPPAEPADRPDAEPEERPAPQSVFAGTAIGVVLAANGNEVPKNGEQMMKALAKLGPVAQLPITYSAVDLRTGLAHPRVVITPRPSSGPRGAVTPGQLARPPKPADPDDGRGEPAVQFGPDGVPVRPALSPIRLTAPDLEGRLFLAANMDEKDGRLRVKTFEFISWNARKQKFDFGFIECDEVEPQIRVVDGVRCFSCHKNRGPILGQGPWSNTPHNDVVRQAVAARLGVNLTALCLPTTIGQPTDPGAGFEPGIVNAPKATVDGLSLLIPQGPAVDAAVRIGADLARDREVYRAMVRSADGRRGLVVLLAAIAAPGHLELTNQQAKVPLNQAFDTGYLAFAAKWVTAHKNDASVLHDFNPAGTMGTVRQTRGGGRGGWGGGSTLPPSSQVVWSGTADQVATYDTRRADGEPGLPSERQPSNPKAFVRPTVAPPSVPSIAVNATQLARLIGLTEGDRAFVADQLAAAARRVGRQHVTAAALARDVFGGPRFAEVLSAGGIPDREDFKDRFVKGLTEALKAHAAAGPELTRRDYASGPNVAAAAGPDEADAPVVPTTSCLRCHDVQKPGKAAFSPIPALAFDPFDKAGRDTWVKATDVRKRVPILARMQKRLSADKDMPPEDSAEYETFRAKSPADFDAVRDWLDAELKKAGGN